MDVPHGGFVMVADGRKLLFFRNEGDGVHPNLTTVDVTLNDNPPDRDQSSDAPGRASSSVGSQRSAMAETDFHQLEEDRFAAEAADLLKRETLAGRIDSIIIVAPPKTLGEMRKHYHKEVSGRISAEVAKDLTGHPVDEIERILMNEG